VIKKQPDTSNRNTRTKNVTTTMAVAAAATGCRREGEYDMRRILGVSRSWTD